MRDFEYEAPATLSVALNVLARAPGRTRPLAGGTDLIDHIRTGRMQPDLLVDVKKIPELNVLELNESGFRLGAAVSCRKIASHPVVAKDYMALADSCRIIGGIQIQNRASVGGNLCNSGPAADTTPSLFVLSGVCVVASSAGNREIPVERFCTAPGQNVLVPGELLIELRFPNPASHSGSHYRRFIPRNEMDIAVVGVAASVRLDSTGRQFLDAKIALGAVGPTTILAEEASASLVGQDVNESVIERAAQLARTQATPITDMRGTESYRKHLTAVLTRRVLETAIARARGESIDYHPGK